MATLAMFFRRPLAAPAAASGAAQSRPVPISVPVDDRCGLRALPNEDIFLYSKPIDNSRVVREPQPTAHGEWSMIGTACALALLFMGLSTPRVANIFAGYHGPVDAQGGQHFRGLPVGIPQAGTTALARRTARSGYRCSAAVAARESRGPRQAARPERSCARTDCAPRSQGR